MASASQPTKQAERGLFPEIRELRSPLERRMLKPLDDRVEVVQFRQPLSDRELKRLAGFMKDYPQVRLRMYGHTNGRDLEWLRLFPAHNNFMVDAYSLETMKGLSDLSSLANAPALEPLLLIAMSHLRPEDLEPLWGILPFGGYELVWAASSATRRLWTCSTYPRPVGPQPISTTRHN